MNKVGRVRLHLVEEASGLTNATSIIGRGPVRKPGWRVAAVERALLDLFDNRTEEAQPETIS